MDTGSIREGELLPSENTLCELFSVTRPTIRQALNLLENEGWIEKHQGKGSQVRKNAAGIGILSITGTTSALGRSNLKTHILVRPHSEEWPSPFMFTLSDWERSSGCISMERVRLVNERPIFYDHNFLPAMALPHFTARNMENRSLFEVLRKSYQIEIRGGEQRLRAIPAPENIRLALNIPEGHPVLHLQRRLFTNRPRIHIYSSLYCDTSDYALFGSF
jgi:GntR family transcriptional regulator/GntR family frlABCD operon transcriptional regulator